MAQRVLALDLARRTGWAVGSTDGVEGFGVHDFPKADFGEYGHSARITFRRMIVEVQPDRISFEAPILVPKRDTSHTLRKIYGLPFMLAVEAFEAKIPCFERDNDSVLAHFLLGKVPRKREDRKLSTKVMARRRGWNVIDDNDADALALLDAELARIDRNWLNRLGLKINAGASALMSNSGADAFAGSRVFFPPATRTETGASPTSSGGAGNASRMGHGSSGATTAIIRQSAGVTSSTSSRLPARQQSLALAVDRPRTWKR